jgi:hypothetical protein
LGIALLVMFIGLIGNAIVALMHTGEHLGGTPDQGRRPDFEVSFLQFLAGLALVSVILRITALLGVFSLGNTVAIAAAVAVASWLWATGESADPTSSEVPPHSSVSPASQWRRFQLTHLFSTTISFLQRPQVAQSRFPRETARARVKYHALPSLDIAISRRCARR